MQSGRISNIRSILYINYIRVFLYQHLVGWYKTADRCTVYNHISLVLYLFSSRRFNRQWNEDSSRPARHWKLLREFESMRTSEISRQSGIPQISYRLLRAFQVNFRVTRWRYYQRCNLYLIYIVVCHLRFTFLAICIYIYVYIDENSRCIESHISDTRHFVIYTKKIKTTVIIIL